MTRIELAVEPAHRISPLLFGQFMERTSMKWEGHEIGPQAALVPGTAELQAGVVEELRKLNAPIIRFPGGSLVGALYDWTDLIDHSPYRETPERPEDHEFGLHEMVELSEKLNAELILAVNFRAAVWDAGPGELPALPEDLAAGLVAYCNVPQGADLPEGMPDWPALRARNGHPEPFGIKYFQIGNEWVQWLGATNNVQEILGKPLFESDEALAQHTVGRLLDMISAMRAVDPEIKIIIDAVMWEEAHRAWFEIILADEEVKKAADFATVHLYRPWEVENFQKDGKPVDVADLTPDELWHATVAAPDVDEAGVSVISSDSWTLARRNNWPITLTEWNWNGFGKKSYRLGLWPRALGVAGFLHAFLRESEHIHLATQSMMLGDQWAITGVRVDPTGQAPPFVMPSGLMTGFYAEHRGDRYLPITQQNVPTISQPITMGSLKPAQKVALVDAVATEDDRAVFLHLINRDRDSAHRVEIAPGARKFQPTAKIHRLQGPAGEWETVSATPGQFEELTLTMEIPEDQIEIVLPRASVTTVELRKIP